MRPAAADRAGRVELDAAGLTDPALRAAYAACRDLHAEHGRTYFLATRLLPPGRRVDIHALYGFARYADEIVDDPDGAGGGEPHIRLDALDAELEAALGGAPLPGSRPEVVAVAETARRHALDPQLFRDFMVSMRMDLTVSGYPTGDDLAVYVHGSAAVIGLQTLPVLGTVAPRAEAEPHAALLGVAFQMTNFLRDVGEDLDRGRVYLPADELAAFGVDRELLAWSRRTGRADPRVRRAIAHLVARTRATYRRADPGIPMLEPVSRACVGAARTLYSEILDGIADAGYDVLRRRVAVPNRRRAAVALPRLGRALAVRGMQVAAERAGRAGRGR
ncbi:Phytoene synthase [Pseudonocardia sp. Ae168_Ps1]|uniref:phytoene/squalene synthase family protein n=1 Tax=Pseudonocardia sp. Ae150A_Ps1 TaxID=1885028 RepID=UPI000964290D|nr:MULTISPECIES: phytoene/squalene synthase family protein [unclassified Pseudonocardia]OLL71247.1 Phytoene synthase [Pseudonocardia sp. Ae168_Ps1]OLL77200.1 Phytoene synthase [Pseudonocardia sp. Ae150A_Ps1]OLL88692.1 Phytoene synthase [Pseudonocardia sp. Ae263_Ps1]OLL91287.1 Phytoene synthase [Pseudonocardia sp. Ae356_Ps1]